MTFVHERLSGPWGRLTAFAAQSERWLVPTVLTGLAVLLALPLVLPGSTYSGVYTNDLMIFLEGGHRVLSGQIPNRDFHTPLGALTVLLPALGLLLGGVGGMMPWATAAFTLIFLPFLLYVCRSRLPLPYGLGFGIYVLLLIIGPVNVGEQVDFTSFAMFYNRFGYAVLSLLFLLVLPRKMGAGSQGLDIIVAAGLLLLTFYLKISYFLLALVFLAALVVLTRMRLMGLLAAVFAALMIALVELFWGGTGAYLADIRAAAEASGALRGSLFTLSRVVLLNLMAVVSFLSVFGIAVWRGVGWQILLLCLYMAGAGVLLINQNAQMTGILTLIPAAMVAILSPGVTKADEAAWPKVAALLLIASLAIPFAAVSFVTIGYFAVKSARGPSGNLYEARLAGVVTDEGMVDAFKVGPDVQREAYRTERPTLDMYNKIRNQRFRQVFSQPEYLRTLEEGARLLRGDPRLGGSVFVFDMANPFNALLGRQPPLGVDAWNHAGRTLTENSFRAPEAMFRDVDVVMVPKAPAELGTTQVLQQVYGRYLSLKFELVGVSDYWRAYRRRSER